MVSFSKQGPISLMLPIPPESLSSDNILVYFYATQKRQNFLRYLNAFIFLS